MVKSLDHLRVVLVSTRNPLNIGAAARALSNFGSGPLRLVNPYDLAWREARSAVGASALLAEAQEFPTLADAVADCGLVVGTTAAARRRLQHPLRSLQQAAPLIRKRLRSAPVALLFGSEKRGLSNDDLSHCHWLLRIPTREQHASMNLGQAVAVCLYELLRDTRAAARPQPTSPAAAADLERITTLLLEALTASGYVDARSAAARKEKLRRLLCRMDLAAEDAELWLGMLRQIAWKLRS